MKSITISLILLLMTINFAQSNPVKQITDYEFDCRNPFILSLESWDAKGELFFEGRQDSAVNIFSLKYDAEEDTFNQLSQITSSKYINRKITGTYVYNYPYHDYKIILWETNQNGNWDIVSSIDSGSGWTAPEFFFNSDENENSPSFSFNPYNYFSNYNAYQLIYSKGDSIYLYNKDTVVSEKILFEGNDTLKYSSPVYTNAWDYEIAAAERRINGGEPYIVYRQKYYLDSLWSEIKEAFKRAPAVNPKFVVAEYSISLSFEVLFNGKRKVIWINLDDLGVSNTVHELMDDQNLETSDFFTLPLPQIITKRVDYYDPYNPYSFRFVRNDSTFIRAAANSEWESVYVDIFTKIGNSHSTLNTVGYQDGIISYTIWEDSSNGIINLFGIKRVNPFGDVKKELSPNSFYLSQNYPNPFNPSTKIQYAIGSKQLIILKVFDLLGREIATLVNEEKPAGEYEVEFNGSSLSSGIYFYQLKAGNFVQTKKLVLLK